MTHIGRIIGKHIGTSIGLGSPVVGGPPPILSDGNTKAWFDYLLGVTESSNRVSVWADQSGNGNNVAQANPDKQPLLQSTGILFNGIDEFLASSGFTIEQPLTYYLVAKQITWTQNDYFYNGLTTACGLVQYSSANELLGYAGVVGTDAPWALGEFGVITNLFHGALSSIQINKNTPVASNIGGNDPGGLVIGASVAGGSGFIHGEIAELIVREISDSAEDKAEIQDYLAAKYGFPTDLTTEWVDDYAQIDFTDNSEGAAQHEIYESKNGAAYTLVTTLLEGVTTYNNYTWQNATMSFKVRAVIGAEKSPFTSPVNLSTPLVFKTDQSTLTQVLFDSVGAVGKTFTIDWGDGTSVETTDREIALTKDYTVEQDPYYITLKSSTDDIDELEYLEFHSQILAYGDLEKWVIPTEMFWMHFYSNGFTGDISQWFIDAPTGMQICHVGDNDFEGDITDWFSDASGVMPSILNDFHTLGNAGVYGDMSGWTMPETLGHMYAGDTISDFPEGSFLGLSKYLFFGNACPTEDVDSILVYIDDFFTGGVVPVKDCQYSFNGGTMGAPTQTGLDAKASIIAKYDAAGWTATITNN